MESGPQEKLQALEALRNQHGGRFEPSRKFANAAAGKQLERG